MKDDKVKSDLYIFGLGSALFGAGVGMILAKTLGIHFIIVILLIVIGSIIEWAYEKKLKVKFAKR